MHSQKKIIKGVICVDIGLRGGSVKKSIQPLTTKAPIQPPTAKTQILLTTSKASIPPSTSSTLISPSITYHGQWTTNNKVFQSSKKNKI